jgi:hypothetical protein
MTTDNATTFNATTFNATTFNATTFNATTFNATTFIGLRLRLNGPGADESAPYAGLPSMTPTMIGNVIQASAMVPSLRRDDDHDLRRITRLLRRAQFPDQVSQVRTAAQQQR